MNSYAFSTVKIVPDLARDEPVNIGVILLDADNNKVYRKFTENWKEVKRRTGIGRLPNTHKTVDVVENGRYLEELSSRGPKDSLVVTKPKPVARIKAPQETLDVLFGVQISLPEKQSQESSTIRQFSRSLDEMIKRAGFPAESYESRYAFRKTVADRKFPYVFLKGGLPYLGIDYLSLSAGNVLDATKIKSCDIGLIRGSQTRPRAGLQKTGFKIFAAQDRDEVDTRDDRVRKSLRVLEFSKIPLVYRGDSGHELDRICKTVSVAARRGARA